MIRKIVSILTLCSMFVTLSGIEAHAQNWDEWFRQRKTQRRYLLKQIALLKVYVGYVKKGVTVARRGLNTVKNIKNGEFNLHKDFFSHLNNVNPLIANSAKVADILAYQIFILQQLQEVNQYCRGHGKFTPEEIRYVADVYANMLVLCDANLSELLSIIRPDKTKMTDDERLNRIDYLHDDMLDKHQFVNAFGQDVRYIGSNRTHDQHELNTMIRYHGIPID